MGCIQNEKQVLEWKIMSTLVNELNLIRCLWFLWSCLVGYRKIMRDTPKTIVNLKFWWQGKIFFFSDSWNSPNHIPAKRISCVNHHPSKWSPFNFPPPTNLISPLMIIFIRENNSLHNFLWEPVINDWGFPDGTVVKNPPALYLS